MRRKHADSRVSAKPPPCTRQAAITERSAMFRSSRHYASDTTSCGASRRTRFFSAAWGARHALGSLTRGSRGGRVTRRVGASFAVALAAGAMAAASLPAVASAAWTSNTPRTVHNFCYLNSSLGPSVRGTVTGTPFVAFDTNHDGVADAWVFAFNGSRYYNTVALDNGEDGHVDYLGLCSTGLWYTPQRITTADQQTQQHAATQQEPASTCAETPGCESYLNQQLFDASSGLGSPDGIITDPDTGNPDGM
jgi:hypothetical protein